MSFKNLSTYGNNDHIIQLMDKYGDGWFIFNGPIVYGNNSAFVKAAELGYYRCFVSMFEKYRYDFKKFKILWLIHNKKITDGHIKITKYILQYKQEKYIISNCLDGIYYNKYDVPVEFIELLLKKAIKDISNSQTTVIEKYECFNYYSKIIKKYNIDLIDFKKSIFKGTDYEFIYTAEIGDFEHFVLLFNKYRYRLKDFNILSIVCNRKLTNGHIKIIKFLLQYKSVLIDLDDVLLSLCNFNAPLDIISKLIEKGADIGKTEYIPELEFYHNHNSCLSAAIRNAHFKLATFLIEIAKSKGLEYYDCIFDIIDLFSDKTINRYEIVKLFDLLIVLPGFSETYHNIEVRYMYEDHWEDEEIHYPFTTSELMFHWRKEAWYSDVILDSDLMEEDKQIDMYFKWRVYHHKLVSEFKRYNEHQLTIKYLLESKIMPKNVISEFHEAWKKFYI